MGKIKQSTFIQTFLILNLAARRRIYSLIILQATLGLFDLAGIAVIGVLASLAVVGIQSANSEGIISQILDTLQLAELSLQSQVAILGLFAAALFISKTLLSLIFSKKALSYLGNLGAQISSTTISKFFSQPLNRISNENPQMNIFSMTSGVDAIMLGVIGATITAGSDFFLMVLMVLAIGIVDPILSTILIITFSTVGFLLFKRLKNKAQAIGEHGTQLTIASNRKISDLMYTYRESFVSDTRVNSISRIQSDRFQLGKVMTEKAFMPNITKYIFEILLVLGALLLSAYQFLISDANAAVATLTVFIAAGSRIAPAALRLQHWALQLRTSLAAAKPTLSLIENLQDVTELDKKELQPVFNHIGFQPKLELNELDFTRNDESNFKLTDINLNVAEGEFVALVGPSGSGKSTLTDLMLGLLRPESGDIFISGVSPIDAISTWPGSISYLPQEVHIIEGTIRENVARGFDCVDSFDEQIYEAIADADLLDFVEGLPLKLDTILKDNGVNLSGGQRQRLGIARALFTKPKLLIMDEGTSALDGETEWNVTKTLTDVRKKLTLIVVAHRLTTVKSADRLFYMKNGKIIARGTFDELRNEIPEFETQALRMGL